MNARIRRGPRVPGGRDAGLRQLVLTQGYRCPEGTLDGTNGVNPDGTPDFPDQVIGEWLCRGYSIGDGAHTTDGAWVYTTQAVRLR
ncbi:MAG: hypothetical protein L0I24_13910 [Pseudonocardia sp.]|nr:hypothetical protein [Pseudonocardia sp.]